MKNHVLRGGCIKLLLCWIFEIDFGINSVSSGSERAPEVRAVLIPQHGLSVLSPAQPAEVTSLNSSSVRILVEGSGDQLHKPRVDILATEK